MPERVEQRCLGLRTHPSRVMLAGAAEQQDHEGEEVSSHVLLSIFIGLHAEAIGQKPRNLVTRYSPTCRRFGDWTFALGAYETLPWGASSYPQVST